MGEMVQALTKYDLQCGDKTYRRSRRMQEANTTRNITEKLSALPQWMIEQLTDPWSDCHHKRWIIEYAMKGALSQAFMYTSSDSYSTCKHILDKWTFTDFKMESYNTTEC